MPTSEWVSWEEVFACADRFLGGDFQLFTFLEYLRGPLKTMRIEAGKLLIEIAWGARKSDVDDAWEYCEGTTRLLFDHSFFYPLRTPNGEINFIIPHQGSIILFPKGGSKLDPKAVTGLPKASRRLIALYPHLTFDKEVAKGVLESINLHGMASIVNTTLSKTSSLDELLKSFLNEETLEFFLWYYIAKMEGKSVYSIRDLVY